MYFKCCSDRKWPEGQRRGAVCAGFDFGVARHRTKAVVQILSVLRTIGVRVSLRSGYKGPIQRDSRAKSERDAADEVSGRLAIGGHLVPCVERG